MTLDMPFSAIPLVAETAYPLQIFGKYQILIQSANTQILFHIRQKHVPYLATFLLNQNIDVDGRLIADVVLQSGSAYILPGIQARAPFQSLIQGVTVNGDVTVNGSVAISGTPNVVVESGNVTVNGSVAISGIPTFNVNNLVINSDGSINIGSLPAVTFTNSSIAISGTVDIGTIPEITITNSSFDIGNITGGQITINGENSSVIAQQKSTNNLGPITLDFGVPASGTYWEIWGLTFVTDNVTQAGLVLTIQVTVKNILQGNNLWAVRNLINKTWTPGANENVYAGDCQVYASAGGTSYDTGGTGYWGYSIGARQSEYVQLTGPLKVFQSHVLMSLSGGGTSYTSYAIGLIVGRVVKL